MNNDDKYRFFSLLKMMLTLAVVAAVTAVSCPKPENAVPEVPDIETKSGERQSFENSYQDGLYQNGSPVLSYSSATYQRALNIGRKNYRIQSDDQRYFLNVTFTGSVPASVGEETVCSLRYRAEMGEESILIVKLTMIKQNEEFTWLWNDFQKVGVIIKGL